MISSLVSMARKKTAPARETNRASIPPRIFQPTFSISSLRSKKSRDFGAGNMTTFKKTIDQLRKMGIKAVCLLPLTETMPGMASPFSRTSNNALSTRIIDLTEIPEIKTGGLLSALDRDLSTATAANAGPRVNNAAVEIMHNQYLEMAYNEFKGVLSTPVSEGATLEPRATAFLEFCDKQSWWLDKYAYFKVLEEVYAGTPMEEWDTEYSNMGSEKSNPFKKEHADRIQYFKYVQMEVYRQVSEGFEYAHQQGIEEIEVLSGVGIARQSAEAFLMAESFDRLRQIGCFPEPDNGYPLQLWGFVAEKDTSQLLEFKVKSFENMRSLGVDRIGLDHACGFLGGYTTFPTFDPALLANGQYRVLNPNDPNDAKIAEKGGRWEIAQGEEIARLDFARQTLRGILDKAKGLKLTAETVGDMSRRIAAELAILETINAGFDITLMRALPWENTAMNEHSDSDRLSWTHDMPPILAFLTGMAGHYRYNWIMGNTVSGLLGRLGILSPQLMAPVNWGRAFPIAAFIEVVGKEGVIGAKIKFGDTFEDRSKEAHEFLQNAGKVLPRFNQINDLLAQVISESERADPRDLSQLRAEAATLRQVGNMPQVLNPTIDGPQLTPQFMQEIYSRIAEGSTAGAVVLPLVGLFTLGAKYLWQADFTQCMNLPGFDNSVGNVLGAWEMKLPGEIEALEESSEAINSLAARQLKPFGAAILMQPSTPTDFFNAQIAEVSQSVAFQAKDGSWTTWKTEEKEGYTPVLQMAFAYTGPAIITEDRKAWTHYSMSDYGFEADRRYLFKDLLSDLEFEKTGEDLIREKLFIGLNAAQNRHHFVVYEVGERQTA